MRTTTRCARGLLAGVLVLAFGPAAHAEKRAFAIGDLYRVKGVGDPTVSPDGRTVVYAVKVSDIHTGKQTVHLWRVDAAGGEPRRLTTAEASDTSPQFSPDGRTIAFVSTRSGEAQLWLMPVAGGEPEKKTDVSGGVSTPAWSPDGRRIAFTAEVWPDCGADPACNRERDERRQRGPLKAHLADSLFFRHWNAWRDDKRTHILVLDLTSGDLRDLTPGPFESPVFDLRGPRGFAFSPDGKELAFASKRVAHPESSTNSDVWTVPVEGSPEALAAPRNLTQSNPAWDGTPRYSPDGRYLAWRTQKTPGYESDRFRIALLDRTSGQTRVLTERFDNWVDDLEWTSDSKRILFTADVKGRTPLDELDVASGRIRPVSAVGLLDAFVPSPDGRWAVVARRQIAHPLELYRISLADGSEVALTGHNAALEAEVDIRPPEEMFVTGAGGKKVQVFLIKPHGFDPSRRYPLILNIHGGPQSQWADSFRGDWQVYPGAGYVVAFPNPHGSTGRGQAYTAEISGDWDGKVMQDIEKVTDALAALPYVDPDRMGAMGWSWGGYAMMWLEGHSTRFKAIASMMGVYDLRTFFSGTEELWFPKWDLKGTPWENPELYARDSPSSYVTAFRTPCLVITGERDYRVPYTQSLAFFTDLQERHVPSRLIVFEKAGHWPAWNEMALYYAAHLDWFHRWLGGDPSPWDPAEMVRRGAFAPETRGDASQHGAP
jgi:dipeptidyl aminopeptidase/acylaminoacyl peptidase